MGRRALRKIDPALDLTPWLIAQCDLPEPANGPGLFGRAAPLEVEIGSGKGLFLETATADHPDRNYLGVEIVRKYARYCAARLARHRRANGKVVHGNAVEIFHQHLQTQSVAAVHVYFPDPWWKARHRKRRVMRRELIIDIERVLEPGGKLHFWTDVREYFEATLDLLATHSRLRGPIVPDAQPAAHDLDYRTHFERRMRLHDEPVYRSEYCKSAT